MLVKLLRLLSLACALGAPLVAHAYTGPGLGLGAIGVALGLVGSLFLALVSVVWYPVKRLVRRLRGRGR